MSEYKSYFNSISLNIIDINRINKTNSITIFVFPDVQLILQLQLENIQFLVLRIATNFFCYRVIMYANETFNNSIACNIPVSIRIN